MVIYGKPAAERLKQEEKRPIVEFERWLPKVHERGMMLAYAPEHLRCDKQIVLTAIQNDGHALQYATPDLQMDKEVVYKALKKDGDTLQHVPEKLRDDDEVVMVALDHSPRALRYASPRIQQKYNQTGRGDGGGVSPFSQAAAAAATSDNVGINIDAPVSQNPSAESNGNQHSNHNITANSNQSDNLEKKRNDDLPVITIFLSSPLCYDGRDGNKVPLTILNFDNEERVLKQALKGKNVRLRFEVATIENLRNLLSKGGEIFHFSGHGYSEGLFFENRHGGGHCLGVNEYLKEFIEQGSLKLAFIAACSSRQAGDTFIEAGVKHVVCAEKCDDGPESAISDVAASIFEGTFYRALVDGNTVQKAFDLATCVVRLSPDVEEAGLIPEVEAKKFVLLSKEGEDPAKVSLFPGPEQGTATISRELNATYSFLPTKPLLLGRQIQMHEVLESMIAEERRLVTVTGVKGIGKASFCKAIGHYMEKRKMWGRVCWMSSEQPERWKVFDSLLYKVVEMMENHVGTDSVQDATDYPNIRDEITHTSALGSEEGAVVIVDATKFQERVIKLLPSFICDLFERTKVKVLVFHKEDVSFVPPKPAGFSSSQGKDIKLEKLDLKSTLRLFYKNCKHATESNWYEDYMLTRCTIFHEHENVKEAIGDRIPERTIDIALKMNEVEYKTLVGLPGGDLPPCDEESDGSVRPTTDPPPVRSQTQVQTRFVPKLIEGKLYRKVATSYIRDAKKGETITTVINGKQGTQKKVRDKTSKVVCGHAAREFYVLTQKEFLDSYNETDPEPIPEDTNDEHLLSLRNEGFKEFKSKRFVRAIVADEDEIQFFGNDSSSDYAYYEKPSYYEAPWGETDLIKKGDYLVMRHELNDGDNDGVYCIAKEVFEKTYAEFPEGDAGEQREACTDEPLSRATTAGYKEEEIERKDMALEKRKKELYDDWQILKEMEEDEDDSGQKEIFNARRRKLRGYMLDLFQKKYP